MSDFVTCQVHPGRHFETRLCRDARSDTIKARVLAWVESKVNPKGGSSWRAYCSDCRNAFIAAGPDNHCVYCGSIKFTTVHNIEERKNRG